MLAFGAAWFPGNAVSSPRFAAGVVGFKCFLIHSGVDEFPNVTEDDLAQSAAGVGEAGGAVNCSR